MFINGIYKYIFSNGYVLDTNVIKFNDTKTQEEKDKKVKTSSWSSTKVFSICINISLRLDKRPETHHKLKILPYNY